MISLTSAIVGVITIFLTLNGIHFLLWFFQRTTRDQQKSSRTTEAFISNRSHQEPLVDTPRPRNEASGSFYINNSSTSSADAFARFRSRLLAARSLSEVNEGSSSQRGERNQFRSKFREAKQKAKQRFQIVAEKYSKKMQKGSRQNSSVSDDSVHTDTQAFQTVMDWSAVILATFLTVIGLLLVYCFRYAYNTCYLAYISDTADQLDQQQQPLGNNHSEADPVGTKRFKSGVSGTSQAPNLTALTLAHPEASMARVDDSAPPSYYKAVGDVTYMATNQER
ncbi:hypothetical protein KGF57_004059 [Candida theae]|uniref:Uncharacterized protein n=1 Tax=Candida theae TaxID=1198502 RepID=A0AAD5BD17_9ASCO|nr:uncharacterized protein KGF57_004059 [Candida theae]KAI5953067.1 hypothetical protein KGF57_004059 [Candida theae]